MRVVFFGTPDFAVPSLEALIRHDHEVAAVVTQPDRPHGRSRSSLVAPPVKNAALLANLPVLQPERPVGDPFVASLRAAGAEIGVVVAYGHILRPDVLAIPPRGMINIHASLLPRWRGAAPVQAAILSGDSITGISVMQMEAGLDSGPVFLRQETPIGATETAGELTTRLAALGAEALVEALDRIGHRGLIPTPQDGGLATVAPKVSRESARVDWSRDAEEISRHVRAFDPWPGAWTTAPALELKLFCAAATDGNGTAGTVLRTDHALVVACGSGALAIDEVQPAGKRRLAAADWLHGRPLAVGDRLG
jgi:methionyl-tRNA formyltransferase